MFACALPAAASPAPSPSPTPSPSPSPSPGPYSDVPSDAWYTSSVKFVAQTHDWMLASGNKFRPADAVTRAEFARSLVRAFASDVEPDPAITFADLPASDAMYPYANVAVKLHWLYPTDKDFVPAGAVTRRMLDRALVIALGLQKEARGLNAIATADAKPLKHASDFSYLIIGGELRLHYNHSSPDDPLDLGPRSNASRADAAYAFSHAISARGSWLMDSVKSYDTVALPKLTPQQQQVIEYAFKYAGYPYVYAGDWYTSTKSGYCCGVQNAGGFDCSGWVWWVLKAAESGYNAARYRQYAGWSLPERSSYEMAKAAKKLYAYADAQPLDILMFDTDSTTKDGTGWQSIDHVGIYLGNGWFIHSSGSRAGVVVEHVDDWWQSHLRWARRIVTA